jgi:hypothetical protein
VGGGDSVGDGEELSLDGFGEVCGEVPPRKKFGLRICLDDITMV